MVCRLDIEGEVAYGHISQGITWFCFSGVIKDVLKVNGRARSGSCVWYQDFWQAPALGRPSRIAEFRSNNKKADLRHKK
jgi:hypothetical protein